jgi:hypothetical protein
LNIIQGVWGKFCVLFGAKLLIDNLTAGFVAGQAAIKETK